MDEFEFQRVLNLFPIVRPRDFHLADTEASRPSIAQPAQSEKWQDALGGEERESTNHNIDQLDTFWVKLHMVAEKKIGAAEAKRFCDGFQKIYKKLAEDIPEDFPFKIEDNTGENVVKLTRQYEGKRVDFEVCGVSGDNEDKDDDDSSETLTLVVRISKDVGPYLEFNCRATPDEISIEDIVLKDPEATEESAYVGPYFVDLDEVIQKAFHKYLAARGITISAMDYMLEYMENKDTREYKIWLENLKKFVEA